MFGSLGVYEMGGGVGDLEIWSEGINSQSSSRVFSGKIVGAGGIS